MGITIFSSEIQDVDSEAMYKSWLAPHSDGFVINLLKSASGKGRKSDARFTRIHRASCKSINPLISPKNHASFTTGRYQKVCVLTLDEAESTAGQLTGLPTIQRCHWCI